MKAKTKNEQLRRYKGNWATFEIMKTLIKNRRIYWKRIKSADQSDGEQGPGDEEGEEGNNDEEGNADEGGNADGEGEGNADDDDWYVEMEGNADGEGEGNADGEGTTGDLEGDEEETEKNKGDSDSPTSKSATTSKSVASKSATTSKSTASKSTASKPATTSKPTTVGLAGIKRKAPEDEDHGADQVVPATGRRISARQSKKRKLWMMTNILIYYIGYCCDFKRQRLFFFGLNTPKLYV